MLELIDPVTSVPWQSIILILLTAAISSAVIIISTQRSVRSIGLSTAKMVASIEAAHQATQRSTEEFMVTLGRAEIPWRDGSYRMRLRRPFRPGREEVSSDQYLSRLAGGLISIGVSSDDMEDIVSQVTEEDTLSIGMDINVRDPNIVPHIIRTALGAGFTEDGSGREEITIDDAHNTAGRMAILDAQRNVETLADTLSIERQAIEMIGADLETLPSQDGKVIKLARARWRALAKAS